MLKRNVLVLLVTTLLSVSHTVSAQNADNETYPIIEEVFHTERDQSDNVDSPAVWHGPENQHWVLATAKEGHQIIIFDANDGSFIRRVGEMGTGLGEFMRPNGIAVIDDLMIVVERDNQRIQVFNLPDLTPLGFFGDESEDGLIYPYGLTIGKTGSNTYELYVSDNYNPYLQGYPAEGELEDRIHHYRFSLSGNGIQSEKLNVFGEIYNDGALHTVESLMMDTEYDRLLIADEAYPQRNVKIYDLHGNFTHQIISKKYFDSEPEGIALYRCNDGSGYWIITDQHESNENKFQVFHRQTLQYLGGFKGAITRNTDGIWLTQTSFGQFEAGALYPVHDDGSITAMNWNDIAEALGLKSSCHQ